MLQCLHPYFRLDEQHARVPSHGYTDIVASCSTCCAVGHDLQIHAAAHEVEQAGQGTEPRFPAVGGGGGGRGKNLIKPESDVDMHALHSSDWQIDSTSRSTPSSQPPPHALTHCAVGEGDIKFCQYNRRLAYSNNSPPLCTQERTLA